MRYKALALEGKQDVGGRTTHFSIPAGREAEAARDLLNCLAVGLEVCLSNDLDEGHEGVTFFRRTDEGLSTKVGGHGWQGDWWPIEEAGFIAVVAELAPHNRGGHWSTQGQLRK